VEEEEQEPLPPEYRDTPIAAIDQYVNHSVRITRRDGVTVQGILNGVSDSGLDIKRRAMSGYAILPVPRGAISKIEVYR